MCGRFSLTVEEQMLIDFFQLETFPTDYQVMYNIAPSTQILTAVHSEMGRRAGYMKWGLVPNWVQDDKAMKPIINARVESLTEKPSFKQLINKRRCVIFADSFFEWKIEMGKKVPYRIMNCEEKPFAFAGLWDRNTYQDRERITCTILTTEANEVVRNIHDRMPVMLEGEAIEMWLNTKKYPFNEAKSVLTPYPKEKQKLYQVSNLVNSPKNNTKDCIRPEI